ncbi:MAG: LytTR family DNA-binding domain-containing protein [Lentimicrobiaceae bacterium]|jgi:hypothetical protein|nr:LytTR family DNA-binding domain-containing protein [Lentimicrobiaceae bacterium]MDD4596899.1 LytTR family DNA-binding domain-containing protein [Lentimicrobiaceae bacterium]MDY0025766.1 LytTR family DNA-binding domain-containing protein [Lentimicrobium sp.]
MKGLDLNTKYPQNYIIKKPLLGAVILFVFSLGFTLLYHPLNSHKSIYFEFELTMLFYTFTASLFAWLSIVLMKKIPFLSNKKDWTLLKELLAIYLVLQTIGIVIFLLAFLVEGPAPHSRWNLLTFFNSCKYSFLIYIFPFAFFMALNYRFTRLNFEASINEFKTDLEQELVINISSSLKKESLSFYANDLLFATSDGNYVFFYLSRNNKVQKVPIRNSISNIEDQLKQIPFYFRCHRAFIVNLNKVQSKRGNALGYTLSLANCDEKIPVSRKNIKPFDSLFKKSFI